MSSGNLLRFEFNLSSVLRPILQYDGHLRPSEISEELLYYMSPFSGLMYGYAGGINMSLLENRRFSKIYGKVCQLTKFTSSCIRLTPLAD